MEKDQAMLKQTITPGAWRVIDGAIVSDTILEYGGFVVCELGRDATPQDKANLLKQAAVPDMIRALKLAKNKLECMEDHFGKKWPIDLSPINTDNAIIAALRKAGQLGAENNQPIFDPIEDSSKEQKQCKSS